jgi:hypothetical protein
MNRGRFRKKLALLSLAVGVLLVGFGFLGSKRAVGVAPHTGLLSFTAPKGFVEEGAFAQTRSWINNEGATLVAMEGYFGNSPTVPADDNDFKQDILDGQKPVHALLGISDFKIEKLERSPYRDGQRIILTGTYVNSSNETIRFEKWHYYFKSGYAQVAYSGPDSSKFPNREKIAAILKGFNPFGM